MAQSADSLNNAFLKVFGDGKSPLMGMDDLKKWRQQTGRETVYRRNVHTKLSRSWIRFSWSRSVITLSRFNIHKLHQAWIINYLFHAGSVVIIVVWFHFITNLPGFVHATFAYTIGQWFKLLHFIVTYCSSQIKHALFVSNAKNC